MTSTIKVDNIQDQDGNNIINENANTITIGASGDTVTLASGASQSGFGRTGTVDWDTTVKTANFTAANGEGYFCNTTSGSFTVTLPSGSAGAIVSVQDYNNTFDSNSLIIDPQSGEKINGGTNGGQIELDTEGEGVTLVYIDSTVGWRSIHQSSFADVGSDAAFVAATGGTITTCGNFKIHTFTGPGTFTVSCAGNACGSNTVDYFVVAGGGSGANNGTPGPDGSGGGGAGGFRLSNSTCMPGPQTSPLATPTALPVSAQGYPITVGGGGAGKPASCSGNYGPAGTTGSNSVFSTITSAGGGGAGGNGPLGSPGGQNGGSGGGSHQSTAGSGNTPPVSPPQGNPGGGGTPAPGGGGGGGAGASGSAGGPGFSGGPGGAGSFVVSAGFAGCNGASGPVSGARYFAGGGGGANSPARSPSGTRGLGGDGGAGHGGGCGTANGGTATANTGSGGGGAANCSGSSGSGGSGIVMIRYKFQ